MWPDKLGDYQLKSADPLGVRGDVATQWDEYGVEAEFNVSSNVFANDPSRPDFSNEAMHFRPEMTRVAFAELASGNAERLAGIPAANEVDVSNVVIVKSPVGEVVDVGINGNVRPVPGEDALAEAVDFAKCYGPHPGPVQPKGKTANSGKQV